MPAYNAEKYIRQAIDSILNQTFRDFIFMIINDGSIDKTEEIILSYNDQRIYYIKNEQNIGLVNTLNKSIELTQTEYYARMDADDISLPERLEWQLDFLKKNPHIGVCGGCFETFGVENIPFSNIPLQDEDIKANLLFSSPIPHPTVMLRAGILKKNNITFGVSFQYDDTFGHKILELEDYALWHKLKPITQFANLEKIVLKYRKEGQNLSGQKLDLIMERKKKYYTYLLNELNVSPTAKNLLFHISLSFFNRSESVEDVTLFRKHLNELISKNKNKGVYPPDALERIIEQKWDQLFYHIALKGFTYVLNYWKNSKKLKTAYFIYFLKVSLNNVLRRK